MISLLHKDIGQQETDNFTYIRIDTELDQTCLVKLDDTHSNKLDKLAEKNMEVFQMTSREVIQSFFDSSVA